mmetsp:Transcript_16161/g.46237  ORF Transcript_16161/g.46237 Transcript_16161/m.46237 type:complete len:246 (+) Transcript_16161:230-967(+)
MLDVDEPPTPRTVRVPRLPLFPSSSGSMSLSWEAVRPFIISCMPPAPESIMNMMLSRTSPLTQVMSRCGREETHRTFIHFDSSRIVGSIRGSCMVIVISREPCVGSEFSFFCMDLAMAAARLVTSRSSSCSPSASAAPLPESFRRTIRGMSNTALLRMSHPMMPTTGPGPPRTRPLQSISIISIFFTLSGPSSIVLHSRNLPSRSPAIPLTLNDPKASRPSLAAAAESMTEPLAPVSNNQYPADS